MAFEFKTGSFVSSGTAGNQGITGVGFEPKCVIVYGSQANGLFTTSSLHWGATDGTNDFAMLQRSVHNAPNQQGANANANTLKHFISSGGSLIGPSGSIVSLDSDGWTMSWSVGHTAFTINYIAFGGDDLTDVKVASRSIPGSTGNQAYTGVGFEPDALMLFGTSINSSNAGSNADPVSWCLGVSDGTTDGCVSCGMDDAADPTDNKSQFRTGRVYATIDGAAGSILNDASVVSFDSDGYTLNWHTAGAVHVFFEVALKGGAYKVGTDTYRTTVGTKAVTGVGFQPTGLILQSINNVDSATLRDGISRTIGAADGTTDTTFAHIDEDNVGTAQTRRFQGQASCLNQRDADGLVLDVEASLDSFDSDGFTLDWTTVDGGSSEFLYFAVGSLPTGGDVFASASNVLSFLQSGFLANQILKSAASSLALDQDLFFNRDVNVSAASILALDGEAIDLAIKESLGNTISFQQDALQNLKLLSVLNTLALADTVVKGETKEEVAASVLDFLQAADTNFKTQSAANALTFSQVLAFALNNKLTVQAANTLVFDQTVTTGNFDFLREIPFSDSDQQAFLQFEQTILLTGDRNLSVASNLALDQAATTRQAVVNKDIESLISFAQSAGRILNLSAANSLNLLQLPIRIFTPESLLALTQLAVGSPIKTTSGVLTFEQTLTKLQEYARGITSALAIVQTAAYTVGAIDVCNYNPTVGTVASGITPPPTTPPVLTKATLQLRWPADAPTLTVVLNNPQFGNTDTLAFNRINRQSRGGTLLIFADPEWPKNQRLRIQIENMKVSTRDQLQTFLRSSLGTELLLDDWEGRTWRGIIVNPDAEITQTGRDSHSATLEFEGELV